MGENVNMIKNLMMFVKELSGEFQKSMLVFGNTLGSLSKKIMNMTDNIETIEKKFNNLTKRVELFSGPNKQREFSFKQISGKIDHSIKNLTSSLASHNELMKIMIQNNTTHLLDEYQTKIKKEFKDTIETSNLSLKLALNIIRNISLNLTNFFDNKENNAHMNSINKLNHFIKSEKKVYQPQKKESFLRKKIIILPKKSNMRIAPKATPPKKIETKVSVNEIGEKDSLEDEDSFDNIAPKQQK